MRKVFFIADPHFGHEKVAQFRGFKDSIHHDNHFINVWNEVVGEEDLVYLQGDLTRGDPRFIHRVGELTGHKVLIPGNHDSGKGWLEVAMKYFDVIQGIKSYRTEEYGRILLSHVPIHPVEFHPEHVDPITFNIHGHLHDAYNIPDKRYINVSWDVIKQPRTLEELLEGRI